MTWLSFSGWGKQPWGYISSVLMEHAWVVILFWVRNMEVGIKLRCISQKCKTLQQEVAYRRENSLFPLAAHFLMAWRVSAFYVKRWFPQCHSLFQGWLFLKGYEVSAVDGSREDTARTGAWSNFLAAPHRTSRMIYICSCWGVSNSWPTPSPHLFYFFTLLGYSVPWAGLRSAASVLSLGCCQRSWVSSVRFGWDVFGSTTSSGLDFHLTLSLAGPGSSKSHCWGGAVPGGRGG